MKKNIYIILLFLAFSTNCQSQILSLYSVEAAEYKSMSVDPVFKKIKTAFHINTEDNNLYILVYMNNAKSNPMVTRFKYKQTKSGATDEYCKVDDNGNVKQDYCISIDWTTKTIWLFNLDEGKLKTSIFKILEPPINKEDWK